MARRAIAQQCNPHPAARQVKWGRRPGDVAGDCGYFPEKIALSRIFGGSIPSSPDFQPWSSSRCQRGRKMKQQKIYPRKSEVQPQSKEPLYAELLRAAKVATQDAASVADVLRACLNKVCDCTQWPFAHARILTGENELSGRSAKEVWRVPFLDPRRFRDRALRMNR